MVMSYFLALGSRPGSTFYAQCGKKSEIFFLPFFHSVLFCKQTNYSHTPKKKKTFQLWKVPQEKFWRKNCFKSILLEGWSLLSGLSVQITDPPGKHYCTELQMWQLGGYNNICDICMPSNTCPCIFQWKQDTRPGYSPRYISRRSKHKRKKHMVLKW